MGSKKHYSAREITVCGVFSALSVICMLLGNIVPLATFVLPAIAGMLLIPPTAELSQKFGYIIYSVVSLLSLFLCTDKELCFVFIFFLGYYPILKATLDKIKSKAARLCVKFSIFNVAIILLYALLLYVFKLDAVISDFNSSGKALVVLMLLLGNFTFYIYDLALNKIIYIYHKKYRARITKSK